MVQVFLHPLYEVVGLSTLPEGTCCPSTGILKIHGWYEVPQIGVANSGP